MLVDFLIYFLYIFVKSPPFTNDKFTSQAPDHHHLSLANLQPLHRGTKIGEELWTLGTADGMWPTHNNKVMNCPNRGNSARTSVMTL